MKRNIILFIILFFIVACDPLFHDDFIIVNNCSQNIDVSIIFYSGNNQNFVIPPQTEYLIHFEEWVGGASRIETIDRIFKTIIVKKENSVSNVNYANYHFWEKKNVENSRRAKYYTDVKYYLTINPKDFE